MAETLPGHLAQRGCGRHEFARTPLLRLQPEKYPDTPIYVCQRAGCSTRVYPGQLAYDALHALMQRQAAAAEAPAPVAPAPERRTFDLETPGGEVLVSTALTWEEVAERNLRIASGGADRGQRWTLPQAERLATAGAE